MIKPLLQILLKRFKQHATTFDITITAHICKKESGGALKMLLHSKSKIKIQ